MIARTGADHAPSARHGAITTAGAGWGRAWHGVCSDGAADTTAADPARGASWLTTQTLSRSYRRYGRTRGRPFRRRSLHLGAWLSAPTRPSNTLRNCSRNSISSELKSAACTWTWAHSPRL